MSRYTPAEPGEPAGNRTGDPGSVGALLHTDPFVPHFSSFRENTFKQKKTALWILERHYSGLKKTTKQPLLISQENK